MSQLIWKGQPARKAFRSWLHRMGRPCSVVDQRFLSIPWRTLLVIEDQMLSGHKHARLREIDEPRFILEQHCHSLGSDGRRHSRLQVLDAVPPDFRDPVVGWRQAARSDECLVYFRLACVALD